MRLMLGASAVALLIATNAVSKEPARMAVVGADVLPIAPGHYEFAAVSNQANTSVSLSVVEEDALNSGVAVLKLTVNNKGRRLVGLSPDEVRVVTDDNKPVAILTYDQMAALAHKSLGGKRFGAGVGNFVMALAAANAGTHQAETTFNGSVNTTFGGQVGTFSGTSTTTTYDPAEQAQAQAKAQAYIAANQARLRAAEDGLDDQARRMSFSSAAVAAGEWKATALPIEKIPSKAKSLSVTVSIGDEVHTFRVMLNGAVRGWQVQQAPPPAAKTPEGVNAWLSSNVDQAGWALANADQTAATFISLKDEPSTTSYPRFASKREYYQPNYSFGLGVLSDRSTWEVDCSGRRVRMVALESHPSHSLKDIMIHQEQADGPWIPVPPGSLLEKFGLGVCQPSTPRLPGG